MIRKLLIVLSFLLLCLPAISQQSDKDGFKDPTLFSRMPHFYGDWVEDKQFDSHEFRVSGDKNERVEGHFLKYLYRFDSSQGAAQPSTLQIIRNYQSAAKRIGGKVLFENDELSTIKIARDGKETWVSVEPYGEQLTLLIVERQSMQQDIVADAAALKGGLASAGHIEVPGIFFDFNKSDVKPDSKPALDQIARFLKTNPSIKVWIVGHTDAVGSLDANIKLSEARATAIVKTLTTDYAISAARISPKGAGPLAPVASNKTEEGRAKNRRVELVEQ